VQVAVMFKVVLHVGTTFPSSTSRRLAAPAACKFGTLRGLDQQCGAAWDWQYDAVNVTQQSPLSRLQSCITNCNVARSQLITKRSTPTWQR
jgi:hypothetical protein